MTRKGQVQTAQAIETTEVRAEIDSSYLTDFCNFLLELGMKEACLEAQNDNLHFNGTEPSQIALLDINIPVSKLSGTATFGVDVEHLKAGLSCFKGYTCNLIIKESTIELRKDNRVFRLPRIQVEANKLPEPKFKGTFKAEVKKTSLREAVKNALKVQSAMVILENDTVFEVSANSRNAEYKQQVEVATAVSNVLGKARSQYRLDYFETATKHIDGRPVLEFGTNTVIRLSGNSGAKKIQFWMAPSISDEKEATPMEEEMEMEAEEETEQGDEE